MKAGADSPTTEEPPAWYSPGLRFACTGCGGCCTGPTGFVFFNREEAARLALRLGVDLSTFYSLYAREVNDRWSLNETLRDGQYDCVFLEHDADHPGRRRCGVYEDRPTQCRTWPFWESNLRHPRDWEQAAEGCPGMERLDSAKPAPECCGGAGQASHPGAASDASFVPVVQIRVMLSQNPKGL